MTKFTCDLKNFEQYISDSSAAIFSEESNKKHDWRRKISCCVGEYQHVLELCSVESSGNRDGKFYFFFELELFKKSTKAEVKELFCRVADAMQFRPNIKVLDRTEHSEAIGYHATKEEPTGDDRYFWLRPKGFDFKRDESGRYCWDEVPEDGYPWVANMVMEVKMTPGDPKNGWGNSFDLGPEALKPINLFRQAIFERDAKVAAEQARWLAEEEAKEKEEERRHNLYAKFKDLVNNEIGHFVMNAREGRMPLREAVDWKDNDCGYISDDRHRLLMDPKRSDDEEMHLHVNHLISWAVQMGAQEPQV